MSLGRRLFFITLALIAAAGAIWIVVAAAEAHKLSGQVFFSMLPLLLLFGISLQKLTDKGE